MHQLDQVNCSLQAPTSDTTNKSSVCNGLSAKTWMPLLLLGLVTLVAYSPVLFNFFAGDDFVHLIWLKDAVIHPELIWRNFHSSWLDGTTTKFYRPLISVFMVTDYLGWRTNGLGFHITNLLFHLTSSVFLYLIMMQITARKTEPGNRLWALTASGLFALYPLHPEAVSWITGRVDSVVTTFCLSGIWFYMRWRQTQSKGYLVAGLGAFVLGLLSKEMAITLPATLVVWELSNSLFGADQEEPKKGFVSKVIHSVVCTLPYWLTVIVYFGVRRLALGTFVGGYDDSLFFIADIKAFVLNWLHALRMTVVPINREIFGSRHILTKLWEVFVVTTVALGGWSFLKNKNQRHTVLFVGAWLVLCLVPVYKIFAIADDLQGSRLAYLATVPLSVLLSYGICNGLKSKVATWLSAGVLILAATLLFFNNQPWRQAGLESNAIRAALQSVYDKQEGDPQTLVLGLPDHVKGAYVSRNALWGMTKFPQLSRDISNCLMVNPFEPIQPFGYLKPSLAQASDQVHIYHWLSESQKLEPISLAAAAELTQPITIVGDVPMDLDRTKRPFAVFKTGDLSCWNIDFVKVNLIVESPGKSEIGADLLYATNISPEFKLANRTHSDMPQAAGEQSIVFAMRGLPEWAFGSAPATLKLLLPPGCTAKIKSIEAVPSAEVMPRIDFANSGYMGTKGYLHLGKDYQSQTITVDASTVPGAQSGEIEITRPNMQFEEQNCTHYSKVSTPRQAAPLKGTVRLDVKDFPAPGVYELRLWAKNKANTPVGVCSDHIVIAVDH